jgi:hypothetical protein
MYTVVIVMQLKGVSLRSSTVDADCWFRLLPDTNRHDEK